MRNDPNKTKYRLITTFSSGSIDPLLVEASFGRRVQRGGPRYVLSPVSFLFLYMPDVF